MSRLSFFVLMAVAGFLAVTVGVTDAVALSGDQNCDPSNECVYDYTQPSASRRWKYNFSSLCSGTDYVFHNATKGYVVVDDVHAACINRSCAHALTASRHVYYANVCGTASQNCLRECACPCAMVAMYHTHLTVHTCVSLCFVNLLSCQPPLGPTRGFRRASGVGGVSCAERRNLLCADAGTSLVLLFKCGVRSHHVATRLAARTSKASQHAAPRTARCWALALPNGL